MRGSALATRLALAALGIFVVENRAFAQQLEWDAGNNTGNGGVEGGAGIWDSGTANWTKNAGGTNINWSAGAVAIFGGAGGDVNVTGVQVAGGLIFAGNNYIIAAADATSSLQINKASTDFTVKQLGDTATISAAITGLGGIEVKGPGTLVLSGANTNSGLTEISGGGRLVSTGAIGGGLTNSGSGSARISGVVNGHILNQGTGSLTITGNLALNNKTLKNIDNATVVVEAGAVTGISTLTNSSTAPIGVSIASNASLAAVSVINGAGATIENSGTLTSTKSIANSGAINSSGTLNGNLINSGSASANLNGVMNGFILNQDSSVLNLGALTVNNSTLKNIGNATVTVLGDVTGISTLTNSSSATTGLEIDGLATLVAAEVINGAGASIVNNGTLEGTTRIVNKGNINSSGTLVGAVENSGVFNSSGTLKGNLTNSGSGAANLNGAMNGSILNQDRGNLNLGALTVNNNTLQNIGKASVTVLAKVTGISTLTNSSTAKTGIEIKAGASLAADKVVNSAGASILNGGTLSATTGIDNTGTLTSTGTLDGALTNGSVTNAGVANISGTSKGAIINQNSSSLTIGGALDASGQTLENKDTAKILVEAGATTAISTLTNSSTAKTGIEIKAGASLDADSVVNETGATILNDGGLSASTGIDNRGTLTSKGTISGAVTNSGTLLSRGKVNGNVANTGAFTSTGTLNGDLTNGSATAAGGVSIRGVINGAILNQSSSILNVIGALDAKGSDLTNTGTAQFAVKTGKTTGIGTLTNNSTATVGVSVDSGATLTAVGINNAAGASIANSGTINSVISNLGSLENNGTVNGGLSVGAGGTLSGKGNLSSLVLNGGTLLAAGEQTISGDSTQNAGSVLGKIIGSISGQYLMAGGSISGSVSKYGTFVQEGGDLAAGANISVDAFGSTGGTNSGATIIAPLRAAAIGGNISELNAAQTIISNDVGGITFVSDDATLLGSSSGAAVTTKTTSTGATDITVNDGITGSRGINAAALGSGTIKIETVGLIDTFSTAISIQTGGGLGTADVRGGVTVRGADAAFVGGGNAEFNLGANAVINAASLLNSVDGQTVMNNAGTLNVQSLSAGGAGNVVLNNLTSGIITLGGVSLSNFNGLQDAFNNSGALNVSGNVTMAGLEKFTSQKLSSISLGNGAGGDRLILGGDLDLAASQIFMDVDLSDPVSNDRRDLIIIGGVLSGSGAKFNFNNIGANGLPAFFEDLTIIDAKDVVDGSSFEVSGLANSGLLDYGLFEKDGNLNLRSEVKADVAGGIVSNFITAQNTVSNAFFKPTSSFVSTPLNPEPNQFGFAPWFRTSGGLSSVGSEGVAIVPSLVAPQNVFSTVSVGYGGYQFGLDGGLFNLGDKGGNIHVGVTAGQIFGTATQVDYNNKTSMTDTFAGGYGIYSNGPFFVDAQLRAEFIDYTVNVDDFLFNVDNAKVKAKRFSAGVSGGYAFKLNDWSIVPAAGYTYALTKTGDLQIEPNPLLQQSASTVSFADSQAHVFFGGLSVARSYLLFDDRVRLSPFVSLTAYHDFGQENEAQLTIMTAPTKTVIDVSSKSGPTYGEVSLGANFLALTPKFGGSERLLTGNVRGDVQFGKDRLAGSLNLQLRMQF